MRIIDKIALNRLLAILANFILSLVKLFSPSSIEEINPPNKPDRKIWTPRWKKDKND